MPSLKALKLFCAVSAAALILSGCGGGSGSGSTPAASASSPSSSVSGSSTSGSTGSSGSTSNTGSSGSGSSGSGTSGGTGSSTTQGSATLKWTAPTANSNGTALTNLAGYYIYYGTSPGSLTNVVDVSNPAALTYVVNNLGAGTWYFAIAAYTNAGLTSPMSNVGSKTIS